jgi:cell division protein FtsL
MAKKLIISIIAISIAMLELVAVRQAHINTVHAMTLLHRKIDKDNERLNAIQIQIETACSPSKLRPIVAHIVELNAQHE